MADVLIQTQNKSYVPRIIEYYEKFVWNAELGDGPLRAQFAFREESLKSMSRAAANVTSTTTATTTTTTTTASTSSSSSSSHLRGRLGTSLLELSRGARGGRGPGLVLVRGVRCSPADFIEFARWRSPLARAIARLYFLGRERKIDEGEEEGGGGGEGNDDDDDDSGIANDSTLAGFSANTAAELASKLAAITEEINTSSSSSSSSSSSLAFLLKKKRIPVRIMALPRSLERLLIDALCDDDDDDKSRAGAGWNLDPRAGEAEVGDGEGEGEGGEGATNGLFVVAAAMDGLEEGDKDEQGREKRGQHDPPVPSPRYRAAIVRPSAVLSDTTEQRSRASRPCRAEWKLSEALAMSSGLLPLKLRSRKKEEGEGEGEGEGDEEDEEEALATTKLLSEALLASMTTSTPPSPSPSPSPPPSPSALVAVDVGAVPGGWTRHLALSLRCWRVVALDPSPNLAADVAALGNVAHVRMRSGDAGALEAVSAAVGGGERCCCGGGRGHSPDGGGGGGGGGGKTPPPPAPIAHLLTCDANEPPVAASEAILPLLPLLKRGALVVLTLKLRFPGRDKGFATRAAMERLAPAGLELLGDPWLFANTMYERTLLLRKR